MPMNNLIVQYTYPTAKIILNRPEVHNAFNGELIQELTNILLQLNNDSKIRIVLLSATGKYFSAGGDLHWMQQIATHTNQENVDDARQLATLLKTLRHLTKPTIAVIQGSAYGGSLGLIACCDIAISNSEANFCFSEVKIGLIPATISPYIIAAIGERQAGRYFLSAEVFSAIRAQEIGLIHQVVANENLQEAVENITEQLLKNSPCALTATKALLPTISEKMIEHTIQQLATIRSSKEGQEGLTAFLEKRKPKWQAN